MITRRTRRLLLPLLAATSAAAIAAGCGGGGEGSSTSPDSGQVAAGPQNTGGGARPERDPEAAESGAPGFAYLNDLPQRGTRLGNATAPVRLVEFGDFLCTFCRRFSQETLPGLVDRHVRDGSMQVVYNPVAFYGEDSERGALAALAAGRQDRLWQYVEAVFAKQGNYQGEYLGDEFLREIAEEVGLDIPRWERDFASDAIGQEFLTGLADAQSAGVQGTPTFVLRGPSNAYLIPGAPEASDFDQAIADVS